MNSSLAKSIHSCFLAAQNTVLIVNPLITCKWQRDGRMELPMRHRFPSVLPLSHAIIIVMHATLRRYEHHDFFRGMPFRTPLCGLVYQPCQETQGKKDPGADCSSHVLYAQQMIAASQSGAAIYLYTGFIYVRAFLLYLRWQTDSLAGSGGKMRICAYMHEGCKASNESQTSCRLSKESGRVDDGGLIRAYMNSETGTCGKVLSRIIHY